ncbi:hypothetical protein [Acinetobacter terrae]|uniref:Uncharacterized protein n=1 Tax=Acinetobacter terrae TaxID=2731247 RepID=A0A7Y2RHU4_9GAMM|nr:hypothetical protein [Acinetobacter terrae]NNH79082.1 hypothetical protein [Acinetobacter terrae]
MANAYAKAQCNSSAPAGCCIESSALKINDFAADFHLSVNITAQTTRHE